MRGVVARVKICGLMRPEDAEAAREVGADFVGLVFAESRRRVAVGEARRILEPLRWPAGAAVMPVEGLRPERAGLPPAAGLGWFQRAARAIEKLLQERRPLVVGVFEGAPAALINAVADTLGLDLVQLGAADPWELCLQVNRPAIKTVGVAAGATAEGLRGALRPGAVSLCLLDTVVNGRSGGTGRPFEWGIATALARQVPLMLAGGLTPENVAAAVERVSPWGVDVSNGVETAGAKDPAKIRAFVQAVRTPGRE